MKLIFLDFDGVVNSDKYTNSASYKKEAEGKTEAEIMLIAHYLHIDPEAIKLLNDLVEKSGAKVIASTTWRLHYSLDELNKMIKDRGATFEIVGVTPRIYPKKMSQFVQRGEEIQAYLDSLTEIVEGFVIIDDGSDMLHLKKHLVQTTMAAGLKFNHITWAMNILNKDSK